MKHIFYLHSHITRLAALATIKHLQINQSDVIFIIHDSYLNSISVKSERFKIKISHWPIASEFNDGKGIIKKIKNVLSELHIHWSLKRITGNKDFQLYVPQDGIRAVKHLIFLKRCKSYFYLEEGLAPYFNEYHGTFTINRPTNKLILKLLPEGSSYQGTSIFNIFPKCHGAFAFSENAFRFLNQKTILEIEKIEGKWNKIKHEKIFVFDAVIQYRIVDPTDIFAYYRTIFILFEGQSFAIKFHPRQFHEERSVIFKILDQYKIEYEVIDDSLILESELLNSNRILYGMVSSLLFYNATVFNGTSYSIYKCIHQFIKSEHLQSFDEKANFLSANGISFI